MSSSRDERAKAAKLARKGVESVRLIVDPPRLIPNEAIAPPPATTSSEFANQADDNDSAPTSQNAPNYIQIWPVDTLETSSRLSKSSPSRIAVLNMASPLRLGGGVLTGATSQAEWLCARTTLYPSLHEEFYRLPEVGAIYTPDVLVCKTWDAEPSDLKPADQFFIHVITAAMLRLPEVETNQQGELTYSEQKGRDVVLAKMRCVMRILRSRHIQRVVLGAWGCGAYGNPIDEIARSWRRALLGPQAKRSERVEAYHDMEVVFAIKDYNMARRFTSAFGAGAMLEEIGGDGVD
ncbi:hypothetical protein V8C34DRAFT_314995 [Trichoderma compactum]